jgi:hypothetical protein
MKKVEMIQGDFESLAAVVGNFPNKRMTFKEIVHLENIFNLVKDVSIWSG